MAQRARCGRRHARFLHPRELDVVEVGLVRYGPGPSVRLSMGLRAEGGAEVGGRGRRRLGVEAGLRGDGGLRLA